MQTWAKPWVLNGSLTGLECGSAALYNTQAPTEVLARFQVNFWKKGLSGKYINM